MVRFEVRDSIACITLDRPDRANALSGEFVERLAENVTQAIDKPEIHTLALMSSGKDFCTGFDIQDLESCSDGDLLLRLVKLEGLLATLWHAPVQTVCFAPGRSWGAGADLLMCCDRRVVSRDASLRFPGPQFGVVLGTRRLAERVGQGLALEIAAHGKKFDAMAALNFRLVDDVCAQDEGPGLIAGAPCVGRRTFRGLRNALRPDRRDEDLAALVRSASIPGLQQAMVSYRDALRRQKKA